jgi:Tfp pilus assembly ATPase PilU
MSNDLEDDVLGIMSNRQKTKFRAELELDFSIDLKNHSRFRVNAFYEKK